MSNTNATSTLPARDDAQKATAEVHKANYDAAVKNGATHVQAFRAANNASRRFWLWLIAIGAVAALFILVFQTPATASASAPTRAPMGVNWSSRR